MSDAEVLLAILPIAIFGGWAIWLGIYAYTKGDDNE